MMHQQVTKQTNIQRAAINQRRFKGISCSHLKVSANNNYLTDELNRSLFISLCLSHHVSAIIHME